MGVNTFIGSKWATIGAVVAVAAGGAVIATTAGGGSPAFPDATSTGVPSGTTLTTYTGPTTITTANTVIDSKTINGCLSIEAANVLVKNSKINCTSFADVTSTACSCAVGLDDGPGYSSFSVTVQDSEVDCGGDPPNGFNNSTAFGSAFITVLRVNIHGCENGFDVNQSVDIEDSYMHDLRQCDGTQCGGDGSHTDGLQTGAGHYSPPGSNTIANATLNITIRHNTILSMKAGAPTDGTAADSYFTTSAIITNGVCCDTNMVIDDNLLGGGAFTLYCEHNGIAFAGTSEVRRNHFTTRYRSTVGAFGPTSDCADEVTSGNVYDDGPNAGQPVPLD